MLLNSITEDPHSLNCNVAQLQPLIIFMKISLDAKFSNAHFVCNYNHSNFSLLYNYKNLKQIYFFECLSCFLQNKCI